VVEEAAPLAEEHRDEMDLELVEDAGARRHSRRCYSPTERLSKKRLLERRVCPERLLLLAS
jgi:hypothetical protein